MADCRLVRGENFAEIWDLFLVGFLRSEGGGRVRSIVQFWHLNSCLSAEDMSIGGWAIRL